MKIYLSEVWDATVCHTWNERTSEETTLPEAWAEHRRHVEYWIGVGSFTGENFAVRDEEIEDEVA
jgi:hypothetical protein